MQTNFFTSLASLKIESDLRLTVRTLETGQMLVTVQITRGKSGEKERPFPAMALNYTPAELDNTFFPVLTDPPSKAQGRFNNKESFIKQMDQFLKQTLPSLPTVRKTTSSTNKTTTTAAPSSPADKKFTALMEKVATLEKEKKYRLAYGALPKETDFPTYAATIQEKKKALMALIDGGDLFSGMATATAQEPASTTDGPQQQQDMHADEQDTAEEENDEDDDNEEEEEDQNEDDPDEDEEDDE